jgi:hypothetical protein
MRGSEEIIYNVLHSFAVKDCSYKFRSKEEPTCHDTQCSVTVGKQIGSLSDKWV